MNEDDRSATTVLIVGATGYIGSAVVTEAVRQGYDVIAVTRSQDHGRQFGGAEVVLADVSDPESVATAFSRKIDVVISCLACRSGLPRDFDAIDYRATMNILNAALGNGTRKFILLYMEPLARHGRSLADFPDGGPPSDDYDRVSRSVTERSLRHFGSLGDGASSADRR